MARRRTRRPPPAADHLLVRLGRGRLYGVPVAAVREVVPFEPPRRIPSPLSHLLGVVELRGEILPVFDVGGALGADETHDPRFVVVLDDAEPAAFVAERVEGIRQLEGQAPPGHSQRAAVAALAVVDDEVVEALDAGALLAALRPSAPPAAPRRRKRPA